MILDLNLAGGALVGALDDRDRAAAPVGIFELVAELLPVALVHLGADFRPRAIAASCVW